MDSCYQLTLQGIISRNSMHPYLLQPSANVLLASFVFPSRLVGDTFWYSLDLYGHYHHICVQLNRTSKHEGPCVHFLRTHPDGKLSVLCQTCGRRPRSSIEPPPTALFYTWLNNKRCLLTFDIGMSYLHGQLPLTFESFVDDENLLWERFFLIIFQIRVSEKFVPCLHRPNMGPRNYVDDLLARILEMDVG